MKRLLLILCVSSTVINFAQKKVTAIVEKNYDEFGILNYVDSSANTYSSWWGSITENKPTFGTSLGEVAPQWYFNDPSVDYTTSEKWGGSTYPLNQYDTYTKSYNEQMLCTTLVTYGGYYRESYSYNANGKLVSTIYEEDGGTGYEEIARLDYTYDAYNRLTTGYYKSDAWEYYYKDTLLYEGTSLNVIRSANYWSDDDVTYYPSFISTITNTEGVPTTIDAWFDHDDDETTPIEWMFRGQYMWSSGLLNSLDVYPVVGGVVLGTMVAEFSYTYDGANQLLTESATGFENQIISYSYDTDGFVTLVSKQELDGDDEWYEVYTKQFHYISTAGLTSNDFVKVKVSPNPATDALNIEAENVKNISIINANGQLLMRQKGSSTVDVVNLDNGMYFIVIETADGVAKTSFVKQ